MLKIIEELRDPYERKARVTPGLLVALPVLVPILCHFGPKHPTLTALVGLLATCGVTYALASIARGRGKQLEERLVAKWGGMPSTLALRHRDDFIEPMTKQRYHGLIQTKLQLQMPTAAEEAAAPDAADAAYRAATRLLREKTRGDKSLLLKENIAYGFHRNMLAMKWFGVFTSLLGITLGLALAGAVVLAPLAFNVKELVEPGLAGGLSLAVGGFSLLGWLLYFDEDVVRRMGFVYTERLLEKLSALSTPKSPTKKTSMASKAPQAVMASQPPQSPSTRVRQ